MPDVVGAFGWGVQAQGRRDERADLIKAPWPRRPQEGLQFGEREFDRIEVGTVRRQKPQLRARVVQGGADRRVFMDSQIVEDHHVAGPQGRHQDLFDIGEETRRVDRAIEHRGRADALEPERGNHRRALPMAAGRVIVEPRAAWTAAIAPQQVGRHATFIEKHVLADIAEGLPRAPGLTGGDDVRA